jgi:hypothetical protein
MKSKTKPSADTTPKESEEETKFDSDKRPLIDINFDSIQCEPREERLQTDINHF